MEMVVTRHCSRIPGWVEFITATDILIFRRCQ
jgi:hypothetical protein